MKNSTFFTIAMVLCTAPMILTTGYAQDAEEEQGNMVWILSQNVSPSNMSTYETWLKEFKAIADETGAPDYGVGSNEEGLSIFLNIGNTMAGYDELNKQKIRRMVCKKSQRQGVRKKICAIPQLQRKFCLET